MLGLGIVNEKPVGQHPAKEVIPAQINCFCTRKTNQTRQKRRPCILHFMNRVGHHGQSPGLCGDPTVQVACGTSGPEFRLSNPLDHPFSRCDRATAKGDR